MPAAVFVVMHIASDGKAMLADILDAAGPMAVKMAAKNGIIENGRAYVAPAGQHILVDRGTIRLGRGPRENMARPAVDPLFRSAALSYEPRVIGVVLSEMLDDGAAGLAAVKRCSGLTIVQDPTDAQASNMLLKAFDAAAVDDRAPAGKLAQVLVQLANEPTPPSIPVPGDITLDVQIAAGRPSTTEMIGQFAAPVALSCPLAAGYRRQADIIRKAALDGIV